MHCANMLNCMQKLPNILSNLWSVKMANFTRSEIRQKSTICNRNIFWHEFFHRKEVKI